MIDFGTLITIGLAFWVVAASPGPANIANATIAMRYGRKPSLIFGAGLSVALAFWGMLAATGMGAVLQASVNLLIGLKLFGAAYLLWLAWQSARTAIKPQSSKVIDLASGNWFIRGLILNLSNPKSVIAWMAALSVGLDTSDTAASVAFATLMCVLIAFANNAFYTMVFSTSGMMSAYERSRRWIDGLVALDYSRRLGSYAKIGSDEVIIGIGTDLANIDRIQGTLDRFGDRFKNRVFTQIEQVKSDRRKDVAGTYAKRWGGEEACSKALGTGLAMGISWKDMGVKKYAFWPATMELTGWAAKRLDELTPDKHEAFVHVTLTDDHPWAQAFVVIEARPLLD